MYCHHPLEMHRAPGLTEAGKPVYTFDLVKSLDPQRLLPDFHIQIACGQCLACRVRKAQEWSARLWLEWKCTDSPSCFLTLTYDEQHVPKDYSLKKEHYQLFLKRLRKSISPRKIRYYVAGEYGAEFKRPHFHIIIFGYDFPDSKIPFANVFNRTTCKDYISPEVAKLWPYGFHRISPLSDSCICYVCKYVIKKLTGPLVREYSGRVPEFGIGSKGIARNWYEKFGSDLFDKEFFVWGSKFKRCRPVRYFEKILEKNDFDRLTFYKSGVKMRHIHDRKEVYDREFRTALSNDELAMYHNYSLLSKKRHVQI